MCKKIEKNIRLFVRKIFIQSKEDVIEFAEKKLLIYVILFLFPVLISIAFLKPILFPGFREISFADVLDKKENLLSILFSDESTKNLAKTTPVLIPDKLLLSVLKLPTDMSEFDFCISQKSYNIDTKENEIPADHKLRIYTGSLSLDSDYINKNSIEVDNNNEICSDDYGPNKSIHLIGFIFNNDETLQRMKEWGLDDPNNSNRKYLYGKYKIKFFLKPKSESVIVIFPIVCIYFWWASLLFYFKVKKEVSERI